MWQHALTYSNFESAVKQLLTCILHFASAQDIYLCMTSSARDVLLLPKEHLPSWLNWLTTTKTNWLKEEDAIPSNFNFSPQS